MRASYEASYLIAKSIKPFSVGENPVLTAAVKMSEIVHGKKYGDKLRKIPVSDDTVARRIAEISDNKLQQLITRLKKCQKFAIQLDETTDVSKIHSCYFTCGMYMKQALKKNCFFVDL